MSKSRVEILEEVSIPEQTGYALCLQWVRYHFDEGIPSAMGYRFIWRRPDGTLQAARGQARIPTAEALFRLLQLATGKGWFVSVERVRDDQETVFN